jgi:hypothetical protein
VGGDRVRDLAKTPIEICRASWHLARRCPCSMDWLSCRLRSTAMECAPRGRS